MTIECYYGECRYHSCNEGHDEGPFCFEEECRATNQELLRLRVRLAISRLGTPCMMPGQTPYTEEELVKLYMAVGGAADSDPGEGGEWLLKNC